MISISIKRQANDLFDRANKRMKEELRDFEKLQGPIWNETRRLVVDLDLKQNAKAFASAGASSGTPWPPLKPATIARKKAAGQNKGTLVATGRLRGSLTAGNHPDRVQKVEKRKLILGTKVPYAPPHQDGAPKVNLPQRPPVRKTPEQMTQLFESMAKVLIMRLDSILGGQLLKIKDLRVRVSQLGRRTSR